VNNGIAKYLISSYALHVVARSIWINQLTQKKCEVTLQVMSTFFI